MMLVQGLQIEKRGSREEPLTSFPIFLWFPPVHPPVSAQKALPQDSLSSPPNPLFKSVTECVPLVTKAVSHLLLRFFVYYHLAPSEDRTWWKQELCLFLLAILPPESSSVPGTWASSSHLLVGVRMSTSLSNSLDSKLVCSQYLLSCLPSLPSDTILLLPKPQFPNLISFY